MGDWLWWRDGVIYQIYPRSFMDTDGDGVGDLEGIRRRLDHLEWLGVDAIWLSPCFPSPMADFGYDVADYCAIDPRFGTLADFDRLLADAHGRGIRVILDWVPNHTSDQHPWFVESRSSRSNPKRDWYVWRDAKADGSPPNNWLAAFGGDAWEPDPRTGQLYLHSFLEEQPDLNWRNPAVVEAMHGVLRFWLDRGVDGFRIDVVQKLAKDAELRDNPPIEGSAGYFGQRHVNDENHPDVHAVLRGVRAVLDAYDERMAVGEVYLLDPPEVSTYYGDDDELHLAFNFAFTHAPWSARAFAAQIETFERCVPKRSWPDVVLSNHDISRHATRFDDPVRGEARARLTALMLLTLRGTPFLYYGEEIGMRDVPIPTDRIQDPLGLRVPGFGRDPERTPMQWEAGSGAGFTTGAPWLPIAFDAEERNVAAQRRDPASLLHLYRELLALRRSTPALHAGSYRTLLTSAEVLAYERRSEGSRAIVALNFASEPRQIALAEANRVAPKDDDESDRVIGGLRTAHGAALPAHARDLELAACEGIVLLVD